MSFLSSQYTWDNQGSDSSRGGSGSSSKGRTFNYLDNLLTDDLDNEIEPIGQIKTKKSNKSVRFSGDTGNPLVTSRDQNDDWLGLKDDKEPIDFSNRETNVESQSSNQNYDNTADWLINSLRKRQTETNTKQDLPQQKIVQDEVILEDEKNLDTNETKEVKKKHLISPDLAGESLVLEAKINVLEMEKEQLQEQIVRQKLIHQEEFDNLKASHEKQLDLLKVLNEQKEKALQEDRNRQVDQLFEDVKQAKDKSEEIQRQFEDRLRKMQSEYDTEIDRMRSMHENSITRIQQQHQAELNRVQEAVERDRTRLADTQAELRTELVELLRRWQESARALALAQQRVTTEQEQLLQQKPSSAVSEARLVQLERRCAQFAEQAQSALSADEKIQNILADTLDNQQRRIAETLDSLANERAALDEERRQFARDRAEAERSVERTRIQLTHECRAQTRRAELLDTRAEDIQERIARLATEELQWKEQRNAQETDHRTQREQLEIRTSELHERELKITRLQNNLERETQALRERKEVFDQERDALHTLAEQVSTRGEQIQRLAQRASDERAANDAALDSLEKLRSELQEQLRLLEIQLVDVRQREAFIQQQAMLVHQEWKDLREMSAHARCTLCDTRLMQSKHQSEDEVNNAFAALDDTFALPGYLQIPDRTLLVWQLSGKADEAALKAEKAFLDSVRCVQD